MSECKNCKLLDGQSITFVYSTNEKRWLRGYNKCECINALTLQYIESKPIDFIEILCKVYERIGRVEGQMELFAQDDCKLEERIEMLEEIVDAKLD